MSVDINNIRMYAKSTKVLVTFPGAFAVGYAGTAFNPPITDSPSNGRFTTQKLNGGGGVFRFDKASRALIKRFRVTLPKLPGVTTLSDTSQANQIGLTMRTFDGVSNTNLRLSHFNVGEWETVNILVGSPDTTKDFYMIPAAIEQRLDFRNIQSVYDAQEQYVQWELDVSSAFLPIN